MSGPKMGVVAAGLLTLAGCGGPRVSTGVLQSDGRVTSPEGQGLSPGDRPARIVDAESGEMWVRTDLFDLAGRATKELNDKLGTPQPISHPRVRELLGETYVLECP